MLARLGLLGELLRLQYVVVDFSRRLVDLKRHGLVLSKQFVALSGHIAKQRAHGFEFSVGAPAFGTVSSDNFHSLIV